MEFGLIKQLSLVLAMLPALASANEPSELDMSSCFVKGVKSKALCGTLDVAENPQQPLSKDNKVPLNVVVLPKFKEQSTQLPVMFLAGGPGQGATELAGMLSSPLWEIRQEHDIILIDQRGTGKSNPLACDDVEEDTLSYDIATMDVKQEVADCITKFKDHHLPSYNTYQAIEDFEAVREALGHKQVHIIGGSYGTRAGFAYLKRHPESVASAVLDSNAPMPLVVGFFGKTSERAFDLLVEDCQAHEACNKSFPDLKQDYLSIVNTLDKQPIKQTIFHPITGESIEFLLTKQKFVEAIRGRLYNLAARQMVPYVVNKAANGDYRAVATFIATMKTDERSDGALYTGLTMNIVCNEDMPRASEAEFKLDDSNYFSGKLGYSAFTDVCEFWPKWQAPEGFAEPVDTDVPVLLISGKYDPVTPPAYGDMAMKHLKNAKHVVIEQGSHVASLTKCPDALKTFIQTKSFEDIDFSCADEVNPLTFFTDMNQLH